MAVGVWEVAGWEGGLRDPLNEPGSAFGEVTVGWVVTVGGHHGQLGALRHTATHFSGCWAQGNRLACDEATPRGAERGRQQEGAGISIRLG